jgi:membrane protease YdiL (CAAX protease family)
VNRLWGLLVALCGAAIVAASPFLLDVIGGARPALSPALILVLQGVQALLLCALAAWAGVRLAPKAGVDAPWLRAIAEGTPRPPGFASMAIEAAAVGSIAAIAATAVALMFRSSLPETLWRRPAQGFWTGASSAFYGGIVEEILLRWGLLTALLALLKGRLAAPFWPANVATALVFGLGHLPAAAFARVPLTGAVVAYVLLGNGVVGLVFGWMFRRRGLEGAMVAHAAADVWLKAALPALLA